MTPAVSAEMLERAQRIRLYAQDCMDTQHVPTGALGNLMAIRDEADAIAALSALPLLVAGPSAVAAEDQIAAVCTALRPFWHHTHVTQDAAKAVLSALSTLAPSAAACEPFEVRDPALGLFEMGDMAKAAIASPSAEAAQPVAWMWPDAFERLMRGDSPRETAHAATSTPDSVPLYASQPQGELREALERLERLFAYPVSTEIKPRGWDLRPFDEEGVEYAVEIIRAALAGRTAG
jgi:hypothetical protein